MQANFLTRQATYWEFADEEGLLRVHFKQKQEHRHIETDCNNPVVVSEHTVLLNYTQPWLGLYLGGASATPSGVLEHLSSEIAAFASPWRTSDEYLNSEINPGVLLKAGAGLLLRGPKAIAELAQKVLTIHGIQHSLLPEHTPRGHMKALIAGSSFVVASNFRIERLAQQDAASDPRKKREGG